MKELAKAVAALEGNNEKVAVAGDVLAGEDEWVVPLGGLVIFGRGKYSVCEVYNTIARFQIVFSRRVKLDRRERIVVDKARVSSSDTAQMRMFGRHRWARAQNVLIVRIGL